MAVAPSGPHHASGVSWPVRWWIHPRIRDLVPFRRVDCLDLDKQLTVGIVQLAYHWSDRCHDGGHRECEAVDPASSVVPVDDVVHSRVSDRASFFGAVELGAVIRDQSVITFAAGVGK